MNETALDQWLYHTKKLHDIHSIIEKKLIDSQLTLNEFLVLYSLSKHPNQTMRLQELEHVSSLSQSAMSRMISRMEQSTCNAYIKRYTCHQDKRGICIALTEKGLDKLHQLLPVVEEVLQTKWLIKGGI